MKKTILLLLIASLLVCSVAYAEFDVVVNTNIAHPGETITVHVETDTYFYQVINICDTKDCEVGKTIFTFMVEPCETPHPGLPYKCVSQDIEYTIPEYLLGSKWWVNVYDYSDNRYKSSELAYFHVTAEETDDIEPTPSTPDVDSDGDGMDGRWEMVHGLDPTLDDAGFDGDGDGLTNLQEYQLGTDPAVFDDFPGATEIAPSSTGPSETQLKQEGEACNSNGECASGNCIGPNFHCAPDDKECYFSSPWAPLDVGQSSNRTPYFDGGRNICWKKCSPEICTPDKRAEYYPKCREDKDYCTWAPEYASGYRLQCRNTGTDSLWLVPCPEGTDCVNGECLKLEEQEGIPCDWYSDCPDGLYCTSNKHCCLPGKCYFNIYGGKCIPVGEPVGKGHKDICYNYSDTEGDDIKRCGRDVDYCHQLESKGEAVAECHYSDTLGFDTWEAPCSDGNVCNVKTGKCVQVGAAKPAIVPTNICGDGTPNGQCVYERTGNEADKPKYCQDGKLVDNCYICLCPSNLVCNPLDQCVVTECISDSDCDDGNPNTIGICQNPDAFYYDGSAAARCIHKLQAKSNIKVGIIEFAPENVKYGDLYFCYDGSIGYYLQRIEEYCTNVIEKHNFLEIFNNPEGQFKFENLKELDKDGNPHSIFYIDTFYQNEGKKYNFVQKPIFEVEVKGPYTLNEDPPRRSRTKGSDTEVETFFKTKAEEAGVDLKQYDVIAYVHFNDQVLSQRDYPGFLSFANPGERIIYNSVDTSRVTSDDAVETIIHELGHMLGASDRYIAPCPRGKYMSCCMDPEGIPEPNKIPKYPQEKACLMCGSIALTYEGEGQNPGNLNNIVICDKTAEEFGWKIEGRCVDETPYGQCSSVRPEYCGSENLLSNSGFEVDDEPLLFQDHINGVDIKDNNYIRSEKIVAQPNTEYRISGWIKTNLSQGWAFVVIHQYNSSGGFVTPSEMSKNQFHFSAFSLGGSEPWTYRTSMFETEETTRSITIQVNNWHSDGALGNSSFRKIRLTDGVPEGWIRGGMHNGVKESGVSGDAYKGRHSYKIRVDSNQPDRWPSLRSGNINVESNTQYIVSAYIKTENLNGYAGIGVHCLSDDEGGIRHYTMNEEDRFANSNTGWVKKYAKFTTTEKTDYCQIHLFFGAQSTGIAYFDAVTLEKVSDTPGLFDNCEVCECNEGEECVDGGCVGGERVIVARGIPDIGKVYIKTFEELRQETMQVAKIAGLADFQENTLPDILHPFVLYKDIQTIRNRIDSGYPYDEWWNKIEGQKGWVVNYDITRWNRIQKSRYAKLMAFVYDVTREGTKKYPDAKDYGNKARNLLLNMDKGGYSGYEDEESLLNFAEAYDLMKGSGYDFEKERLSSCGYDCECKRIWYKPWEEECKICYGCEKNIKDLLRAQMKQVATTEIYNAEKGTSELFSDNIMRKNNHHIRRYSVVGTAALVLENEEFFNNAMEGGTTLGILGDALDLVLGVVSWGLDVLGFDGASQSVDSIQFDYKGVNSGINHQLISDTEGGWAEGPHYMEYTFLVLIPFMKAMDNADVDYSWLNVRKLKSLIDWSIKIRMPNGQRPSYDNSVPSSSYFFGGYFNNPLYNWDWINSDKKFYTRWDSAMQKIDAISYYDSSIGEQEPSWTPTQFLPSAGNMVFRSDWGDDAVYLMALGEHGTAFENGYGHEHDDVFSFILYAYGKELAIDSGYYDWNDPKNPEKAENHNVVLNKYGGRIAKEGYIKTEDSFTTGSLDYGEIKDKYDDDERGILFVDKKYFIIYDKLKNTADYIWMVHGNGLDTAGTFKEYIDGDIKGGEWVQGDGISLLAYSVADTSSVNSKNYNHYPEMRGDPEKHTTLKVSKRSDTFLSLLYPAQNGNYPKIFKSSDLDADVLRLEKDNWEGIAFVNKNNQEITIADELGGIVTDALKGFVKITDNQVESIFADDVTKFHVGGEVLFDSDSPTTVAILFDGNNIEIYYKYYSNVGDVKLERDGSEIKIN